MPAPVMASANVDDPDPSRPEEQTRVQAIVDERLGIPWHVPFDDESDEAFGSQLMPLSSPDPVEEEITVRGLAVVVADEKAESLDRQRPAVRELGGESLKRLILCIFRDLSGGAGGADVELVMDWLDVVPTGIELNALSCCSVNQVLVAGENYNSYPVVVKVS